MPIHSTADILRRWRATDKLLMGEGLHIPTFAKKWRVSEKTVRRDLKAFEELGRRVILLHCEPSGGTVADRQRAGEKVYKTAVYTWKYRDGVRPLFRHDPQKR